MGNKYIDGKRKPEQSIERTVGRPTEEEAYLRDEQGLDIPYSNPEKKIKKILR